MLLTNPPQHSRRIQPDATSRRPMLSFQLTPNRKPPKFVSHHLPCLLDLLTSRNDASPPAYRSGSTSRKPDSRRALELLRRWLLLLCRLGGLCSSITTTSSSSSSVTIRGVIIRGGGGAGIGGGAGGGACELVRRTCSSTTTRSGGGTTREVRTSTVSRRAGLRWWWWRECRRWDLRVTTLSVPYELTVSPRPPICRHVYTSQSRRRKPPTEPSTIPTTVPGSGPALRSG